MQEDSKIYQPTGGWRHNPLSNIPGGCTVVVHYPEYVVKYDNIKNPSAYIKHITSKDNSIINVTLEGCE